MPGSPRGAPTRRCVRRRGRPSPEAGPRPASSPVRLRGSSVPRLCGADGRMPSRAPTRPPTQRESGPRTRVAANDLRRSGAVRAGRAEHGGPSMTRTPHGPRSGRCASDPPQTLVGVGPVGKAPDLGSAGEDLASAREQTARRGEDEARGDACGTSGGPKRPERGATRVPGQPRARLGSRHEAALSGARRTRRQARPLLATDPGPMAGRPALRRPPSGGPRRGRDG